MEVLNQMNVDYEVIVAFAHRTPQKVLAEYANTARDRGIFVLIALAGGASALLGTLAAWTTLPVIDLPVLSTDLNLGVYAIV